MKTLQATDHKRAEDNLVVNTVTAFTANQRDEVRIVDVVGALSAEPGSHQQTWVKTVRSGARGQDGDLPPEVWAEQDVSPTLNVFDNNSEARATVLAVTPLAQRGRGDGVELEQAAEGDPFFALRAGDGGSSRSALIHVETVVAFSSKDHGADAGDIAPTLRAVGNDMVGALKVGTGLGIPSAPAVHVGTSTVRRLTPVECERLMGWPDGHTSHRVDFRTGRVVAQADSSRYRQCGNGMAAPVVEWIARRIVAVETTTEETA